VEQGAWWAETEKCLDSVMFLESTTVETLFGGGNDKAGFVQVMRGSVKDPQKLEALGKRMDEVEAVLHKARPDVIGDVMVLTADGSYLEAIYFTSEAEAREGEARELPADAAEVLGLYMEALAIDEYLDLKSPWLH